MENKQIFENVDKALKQISKELYGTENREWKIFTIYECYKTIEDYGIGDTDKQKEKLCNFIYDTYMESDSSDITINVIVNTISYLIEDEFKLEDVFNMTYNEFIDKILF